MRTCGCAGNRGRHQRTCVKFKVATLDEIREHTYLPGLKKDVLKICQPCWTYRANALQGQHVCSRGKCECTCTTYLSVGTSTPLHLLMVDRSTTAGASVPLIDIIGLVVLRLDESDDAVRRYKRYWQHTPRRWMHVHRYSGGRKSKHWEKVI